MSTYENYSSTSQHYDIGRVAVGGSLISRLLQDLITKRSDIHNISQLKILDVGCGTGNYLTLLHKMGCRCIVGVEVNNGMLAKCNKKLVKQQISNDVILMQGNVLNLPFVDETFDAILANQMLHHVDTNETRINKDYCNAKQAIREMCRVLTSNNGILLINECRYEQGSSLWWHNFTLKINNFNKNYKLSVPNTEWFQNVLNKNGFKVEIHDICEDMIEPLKLLNDPNMVLDPKRRAMTSGWSLMNEKELEKVVLMVKEISQDKEKWNKFLKENQKRKQIYGTTTYYVGHKIHHNYSLLSKL